MNRSSTLVVFAVLIGACSGSSGGSSSTATGSATVTGKLLGAALNAQDAVAVTSASQPYILITDFSGACALGTGNLRKNSSGLDFNFTGPIKVGTFKAPSDVDVQYATYDSTCNSSKGESSTDGTVTITSVDSSGVKGTFKLTLNSDQISGSFDAAACSPAQTSGGCM